MAKTLRDIVGKAKVTKRKGSVGGFANNAEAEKEFVSDHEVEVHDYPVKGDGDLPFKDAKIKQDTKHGHTSPKDERVYKKANEEVECNHSGKGKSCPMHGKKDCSE